MINPPVEVSVVVACYNEEPIIRESVAELIAILGTMRHGWEIIFIDDGSRDRTIPILQELTAGQENMRLVIHQQNVGRGGTVTEGLRLARGKYAGFIDIDLETHARYIPALVNTLEQGADLATAWRIYKLRRTLWVRAFLSKGYIQLVAKLLKTNPMDTETGCKFFNRERILPILDEMQDTAWFWDTEIMIRSYLRGYKIVEVPTLFIRQYKRVSSVHVVRDTLEYFRKLWQFRAAVKQIRQAGRQ